MRSVSFALAFAISVSSTTLARQTVAVAPEAQSLLRLDRLAEQLWHEVKERLKRK